MGFARARVLLLPRRASTCGARRAAAAASAHSPETRYDESRRGAICATSSIRRRPMFEGMAVTCSHFVRKSVDGAVPRSRRRCACRTRCRSATAAFSKSTWRSAPAAWPASAPARSIASSSRRRRIRQTKQMVLTRFDIDIAKCMYCGLCSEPCPTGSIHHTPEFEGADFSLESMIRRYVKEPVAAYRPEEGRDRSGGGADPRARHALPRGVRRAGRRRRAGRAGRDRERGMTELSFFPIVFYLLAAMTVGLGGRRRVLQQHRLLRLLADGDAARRGRVVRAPGGRLRRRRSRC